MTKASNEPLISVIVPVYKVEEYLDKCVESIVNQTYKNLEIILVDDGSPDNCPQMCDEWAKKDARIKVIHKENGGVCSARNIGLDTANGEWISFVDADDYVEIEYLKEMYYCAAQYTSDYVCCGYNRVYKNKSEKINSTGEINIIYNPKEYIMKLLNVQNGYGFVHMKLINKNIIKKIRFDENLDVGEDALFNIQLCKQLNKVVICNKALYNYRLNTNSVVKKYDKNYVEKYTKSMIEMNNYLNIQYGDDLEISTNSFNYIAYHMMLICVNYCFHPQNNKKYKSLKELYSIEIYLKALKKSNYKGLSFTRKITLFALKHRIYLMVSLICMVRQTQFK